MEVASVCLHVLNPFDVVIGKLHSLRQQLKFAETDLVNLTRDFENTRRHLSTLQSFLDRAELPASVRQSCEVFAHDLQLQIGRLENLTDSIELSLNKKSHTLFRREKHRVSWINGELENIRRQNNRIDSNISAIREEVMIEIALSSRKETRVATDTVKEQLKTIEQNTKITDAKRIREIYRASALHLISEEQLITSTIKTRTPTPEPSSEAGDIGIERRVSTRLSSQVHVFVSNPEMPNLKSSKSDFEAEEFAFSSTVASETTYPPPPFIGLEISNSGQYKWTNDMTRALYYRGVKGQEGLEGRSELHA